MNDYEVMNEGPVDANDLRRPFGGRIGFGRPFGGFGGFGGGAFWIRQTFWGFRRLWVWKTPIRVWVWI